MVRGLEHLSGGKAESPGAVWPGTGGAQQGQAGAPQPLAVFLPTRSCFGNTKK